jgi:serine/threonine-protein kinase
MSLGAGDVFAGYTIVRLLGSGGMGEVYLAQHPRLPRGEALKILRPEISLDETFQQRFIREADSIAALEHPHIVTVHDRGDTEGRLWIATQYVDGTDAAKLLLDRYPAGMPADEAATITTAIAEALDYAHDRGLLHRDVKPANILLTQPDRDGTRRTYLADFGIARPLDDPAGLTATNFTLGTFAYAAPEQLMGKAIGGRADQYALAATTFHLLTGRPVFPDSNPVAVISQHLTQPPPAPSTIRPELASLDAAFDRALAKSPEDRFPCCQDFARAITVAAAQTGVGFSPTAPTQEAPVATVESTGAAVGRRSPARAILAAAALIGLVAAGVLIWQPWARQGEAPPSTPASTTSSATVPPTPTTTTPSASTPPPPVTTSQPPPTMTQSQQRPKYPPAGALGSACPPPGGAIGTGPDGAIYYCARRQYTDSYEWSLTPGDIPNPLPPLNIPPGYPCMVPGGTADTVNGTLYCKPTTSGGWAWQY